jgi:hypothetical protein
MKGATKAMASMNKVLLWLLIELPTLQSIVQLANLLNLHILLFM